jgi:hypothetical protein
VRRWAYGIGLLVAVTAVIAVDRSASDVSNQAALLTLLVAALATGFPAPQEAWLSGLVLGAAIPVAHIVYLTAGPALPYRQEPPGVGGAATLLVLVLPATAAAYLGAGLSRLRHGRRAATRPPS